MEVIYMRTREPCNPYEDVFCTAGELMESDLFLWDSSAGLMEEFDSGLHWLDQKNINMALRHGHIVRIGTL